MTDRQRLLAKIALLVGGLVCGLLVVEAAYRVLLVQRYPHHFDTTTPELPPIGVYDRSLWEFDRELGYRYVDGPITLSHVDGGQVTSCQQIPTANARGNMGRIRGGWEGEALKVAVFGDSFTASVTLDNMTWPAYLQDRLEQRFGAPVGLVNFGRDGIGILQMFDIVRAKLPEWRPDIAIIAFTTNDLARARFWRTSVVIDGEPRVLTIPEPRPEGDPLHSQDTFVIHPEATLQWCEAMSYKGMLDRVGREIVDKYLRFRQHGMTAITSPFTLATWFVWSKIWHGDAFHVVSRDASLRWVPGLAITDYREDPGLLAAWEEIGASGVPLLLVHIPIYPEVRDQQEYQLLGHEALLLESLREVTGLPIHGLIEHFEPNPLPVPEKLNVTPDNYHPSDWGMQVYARAVTRILEQNGYLERARARRNESQR